MYQRVQRGGVRYRVLAIDMTSAQVSPANSHLDIDGVTRCVNNRPVYVAYPFYSFHFTVIGKIIIIFLVNHIKNLSVWIKDIGVVHDTSGTRA